MPTNINGKSRFKCLRFFNYNGCNLYNSIIVYKVAYVLFV